MKLHSRTMNLLLFYCGYKKEDMEVYSFYDAFRDLQQYNLLKSYGDQGQFTVTLKGHWIAFKYYEENRFLFMKSL